MNASLAPSHDCDGLAQAYQGSASVLQVYLSLREAICHLDTTAASGPAYVPGRSTPGGRQVTAEFHISQSTHGCNRILPQAAARLRVRAGGTRL